MKQAHDKRTITKFVGVNFFFNAFLRSTREDFACATNQSRSPSQNSFDCSLHQSIVHSNRTCSPNIFEYTQSFRTKDEVSNTIHAAATAVQPSKCFGASILNTEHYSRTGLLQFIHEFYSSQRRIHG